MVGMAVGAVIPWLVLALQAVNLSLQANTQRSPPCKLS